MKLNTLRPRRLRLSAPLRAMVRENHVCLNDLIYPFFVVPGTNVKEEIPSKRRRLSLGQFNTR